MVLDIIFIVLILLAFIAGRKQGLIKSIWKLAAWIITFVAVSATLTPTVNFLHSTALSERVYTSVYNVIAPKTEQVEEKSLSELTSLPEWMLKGVDEQIQNINDAISEQKIAAAENTARIVTDTVIKIIAAVGLFILIRLLLSILFHILDIASKLPVINGANNLLGGIFSALSMLIGVFIALALVSLFANPSVYEIFTGSKIVGYLFTNNILMRIFMI